MILDGLSNINIGDWIIAYNNDVIVGSRQWNGGIIDIPVMGYDGSENTIGYCDQGDLPDFKVYSSSSDHFINITSDNIPGFELNSIIYIDNLENKISENIIPDTYNIVSVYPNPFNPETTIEFSVSNEADISLVIYNLYGEKVTSLADGNYQPGYYTVIWDANQYSSGIYFVNMITDNFTTTQKLVLVK